MHRPLRVCFAVGLLVLSTLNGAAQSNAPGNLQATVNGTTVTFNWTTVGGATSHQIEAGSAPGLSDLATLNIGAASTYTVSSVPAGAYYVRVRASVGGGVSAPSNEVRVVVAGGSSGPCLGPPGTPTGLRAVVDGTQVRLSWTNSGCSADAYVVRAGSSPGTSDIATLTVTSPSLSANAPDGVYFVSIVAINAFGASLPTGSLVIPVAAPTAGGRVGFNASSPAIVDDGTGHAAVIGEVVNRSLSTAVFVQVAAEVRGDGGGIVGTGSTFLRGQPRRLTATGVVDDSALPPGEIGCFYIQTTIPLSAVRNASLQVSHDAFASSPMTSRVDVVDVSRTSGGSTATVALAVANRGPISTFANLTNLYLKRADGRAVGCDFAFVQTADAVLAPGQSINYAATTHAPSNAGSVIAWMHWQEPGDPLAGLATQTFQSMRTLAGSGQKRDAIAAWESLQQQRRALARQVGR